MPTRPLMLLALLFGACKSATELPSETDADTDTDTDTDSDTDADTDSDTDADTDSDTDADTDSDTDTDTGSPFIEWSCEDGVDDDLDGATDCADYDCLDDAACVDLCPAEDGLEDNDEIATASLVTSATDLMVHHQDADVFAVGVLETGELARVQLAFTDADGDIELALRDGAGNVLDLGSSFSDDELAEWVNSTPNPVEVYAEVTMWQGAANVCNRYDIELYGGPIPAEVCDSALDDDLDGAIGCADYDCLGDAACPACPPEDGFEPNDLASQAAPLEQATDLAVHAIDADFYRFDTQVDDIWTVRLDVDPAGGEVAVTVRDAAGTTVYTDQGTGELLSTGRVDAGQEGSWTIEVRVVSGDCGGYDASVEIEAPAVELCDNGVDDDLDGASDCDDYDCIEGGACVDVCPFEDALEDNDVPHDAFSITGITGMGTFGQDPDFYVVESDLDHLVRAEVHGGSSVELVLYDSDEHVVAEAVGTDPVLTMLNEDGQPFYYLEVRPDPAMVPLCAGYDLVGFQSTAPPAETCDSGVDDDGDGFSDCMDYDCFTAPACLDECPEEDAEAAANGTMETASVATSLQGVTHIQQQDFYTFDVAPGEVAEVRAAFVHAEGNLEMEVLDADGDRVYLGDSTSDDESWSVANLGSEAQTYWVRVFPHAGYICGSYDWSVAIGPIPEETCDDTVDNDFDGYDDCEDYACIDDASCQAANPTCPGEDAWGVTSSITPLLFDPTVGFSSMTAHKQQSDWFTFTLPAGEYVDLDALFTDATADVFLQLYDPQGAELDRADSFNDNEDLTVLNPSSEARTYLLEVGVDDFLYTCNTYDLVAASYGAIPAEDCGNGVDDDFDGFDDCDDYACIEDASCVTATCPGEDGQGGNHATQATALPYVERTGMTVHEQAPDWYTITLDPGTYLTTEVQFIDAPGNIFAEVWDASGEERLAYATTSTDNETITVHNPDTVAHSYGLSIGIDDFASVCNTYDLVTIGSGPIPAEDCTDTVDNDFDGEPDCHDYDCGTTDPTCACPAEDVLEDNDTADTAVPGITERTGLAVFHADKDFFAYTVAPGETLNFDAFFVHALGDVNLRLATADNVQLATGSSTTDNETVSWTNTTETTYDVTVEVNLRVFDVSGCNGYDMIASVR